MVRSCDVTSFPPKLFLSLDVAGKTEQMDGANADEVHYTGKIFLLVLVLLYNHTTRRIDALALVILLYTLPVCPRIVKERAWELQYTAIDLMF